MIAALLLRYGIPTWLAQCVGIVAVVLGLWAGIAWHDHSVFAAGEAHNAALRDKIDADNNAKAEVERARLNVLIAKAQVELDAAKVRVAQLEKDRDHERTISADRQQRLLAGTERERVLIRAIQSATDPHGQAQGGGIGAVDSGGGISATLDGRVASDLEWVRQTRNDALKGLQACIVRFDALTKAVNAQPE